MKGKRRINKNKIKTTPLAPPHRKTIRLITTPGPTLIPVRYFL